MFGFIKLKSMDITQAETALHAHLSNHAWQHMEGAWRPSHQWGLGGLRWGGGAMT